MSTDKSYAVKLLNSIHEANPEEWDSILGADGLLHRHRFIKVTEEARVENSRFWYLMFYQEEQLVATAALSAFEVSLSLFLEERARRWIERIRRFIPGFMKIEILCCGLPVSLGQSNFRASSPRHTQAVAPLLAVEMQKIAAAEKIKYLCVKEFREEEARRLTPLVEKGFFRAHSIPYMEMDVPWNSFEAYLQAMRHHYRRSIRRPLRKLNWEKPVITESTDVPSNGPALLLSDHRICSPALFHRLYLEVMQRTDTKLEELNLPFFEKLEQLLSEDVKYLSFWNNGELQSIALLAPRGPALTFLLVGMEDPRKNPWNPYFNLTYGIVAYAIEQKFRTLRLGQTAYWVKQRIGGERKEVYLFFRARNPLVHLLLKALKGLIFPKTILPQVRVFKTDTAQTGDNQNA